MSDGSRRPRTSISGVLLLIAGLFVFQTSVIICIPALDSIGIYGTASLRLLVATAALWIFRRPPPAMRTRRVWLHGLALGVAVVTMNVCVFGAITRIPLGTVTTIEFLGPLSVAVLASRTRWHVLAAVLAGTGVVLVAGPTATTSAIGLLLAAGTAAGFAGYLVVLGRLAGAEGEGPAAVTIGITFAALALLPFGIHAAPNVDGETAVRLVASGLLGTGLGYLLEGKAIGRLGSRAAGVLFSLDPAIGSLLGLVILGQALGAVVGAGIAIIVVAGIVSSLTEPRDAS